jgi:hypothetical protein
MTHEQYKEDRAVESQQQQAPGQPSPEESCQRLNEEQLINVQGAGWPLGQKGVQEAVEKTGGLVLKDDPRFTRSRSAPALLQGNVLTPWTGRGHSPAKPSSSGSSVENG